MKHYKKLHEAHDIEPWGSGVTRPMTKEEQEQYRKSKRARQKSHCFQCQGGFYWRHRTGLRKLQSWRRVSLDIKTVKYIFLLLILSGCHHAVHRVGIIHDYIFANAIKMCKSHQGLHYIVAEQDLTVGKSFLTYDAKSEFDTYPCHDQYHIRCQDGKLLQFDDGVGFCFISEGQLKETFEGK